MSQSMDQYIALATAQHREKPRFQATARALLEPLVDLQGCLLSLPIAFDLDTAVGVQLDAIGLWVGVGRRVPTELTGVYFALDTEGVGLDQGVWRGPFDPLTGLSVLDDESYRTLLRVRIAANGWDGRQETAILVLQLAFPDNGVVIEDYQNMSMSIALSGLRPSAVARALLREGFISLKPAGVRQETFVSSTDEALFALDVPNGPVMAGLDTGGWAVAV